MAEYPNRTDLQNPARKVARAAAKGQTYGEAGKQIAAQKAVPMASAPTDAAPAPRPRPQPGGLVPLDAMTTRPGDSLVGAANRPSDAPVALPMRDPVVDELEVLYRMYPNDDLASLISALKWGGA